MSEYKANIKEIFFSIQGEGPYIGYKQIFIRFCGCNLECVYCDTDYEVAELCEVYKSQDLSRIYHVKNPLTVKSLFEELCCFFEKTPHSISFTGGEPLLYSLFIKEFGMLLKMKNANIKNYLETNGTLAGELEECIDFIDIISMDIKLESSTGCKMPFAEHKKFIEVAKKYNKEIFVKIVVSSQISKDEIKRILTLIKTDKFEIPLIIQPLYTNDVSKKITESQIMSIVEDFSKIVSDVRVIPQTHKFLNLL